LILGDYRVGESVESLAVIRELGELGAALKSPVIAGARPELVGLEDFTANPDSNSLRPLDGALEEAWNDLRNSPVAAWISLALPRFLLRQPYGAGSDEIDCFEFEELRPRPDHETFLWANSAFACARLIIDAFQEAGWQLAESLLMDIDDLPLVVYNDGTGSAIKPTAECLITEKVAGKILSSGLVPLLSYRDRNQARVHQLRSISIDGRLAGLF
jgi:type VI secretion system protein ImpC